MWRRCAQGRHRHTSSGAGRAPHSSRGQMTAAAAPRDDLDEGLVWGIASMAEMDGAPVVDHDGDTMSVAELQRAAHEFMRKSRVGGALHIYDSGTGKPLKAGDICESVVLTKDLQRALGIELRGVPWVI